MITQNYTKQLRNIHINIISKVELKKKKYQKHFQLKSNIQLFKFSQPTDEK